MKEKQGINRQDAGAMPQGFLGRLALGGSFF
jgi:hypothetical protein